MNTPSAIDPEDFDRLLSRNLKLPLIGGVFGAVVFVGLILFLLNTIGWVEHTDRVTRAASELQRQSIDMETGMRGFLITGDETFLEPYQSALPRMKTDTAALRELVSDNRQQVERLDRIAAIQGTWIEFARSLIAARRAGEDAQAQVRLGRGKRLTDDMRAEFTAFIDTEQALRFQRNNDANRTAWWVICLFLLFTLTLTGLVAYFGRRQLMRLSESYDAVLKEQAAHTDRLSHEAWLRGAQTELVGELVGELSAPDMGRKILAFFSRHLGTSVGAMYVRERHGPLRRASSYGFSSAAEATPQVFSPTESLVGQAAAERRRMVIEPVTADYLKVNSGLGEMTPQAVLLLPVASDGMVNGVIELGLPGALDERGSQLLDVVADDIGSSLAAARYREQLQDVLAETQQLNEELQVQQEELRTANEELEEQSRALRASQAMLENQQAELEQTNSQLSERTEALDQRNTALRRVQRDLEDRADELQRASRYKSEFLANMSHELRTPLNSALILAKLLGDNPQGNLSPEQVKFAESIYSSGNDLLVLINDILDISKVEAGKLEVVPEDVPLRRLAESLETTFRPLAMQKNLSFRLDIRPDAPGSLVTDSQRVEQILKNLLSNALKFTDRGEVALVVSGTADGGAAFAVSDSGIGIDPQQHELIFEAFRQADGTTSRRYGGTGLGLSISRDLTQLLGGTLAVQSQPGQGSTFVLQLPAKAPQASGNASATQSPIYTPKPAHAPVGQAPAAPATPLAPQPPSPVPAPQFADDRSLPRDQVRRVLVIEDEPQFAHILYDLAHELGYRCLVAHGAADGFELATQFVPDAILLDMRLPDSTGLDVLQRLKDSPHTRHIPIHVVSAADNAQGAALQMGAIGYALKPTTRDELMRVFARLEDKLTQKVKVVLLVEDDDLQRESVMRLIEDDDIEIVAVGSGEEALELLRTRVFDCMITDLRLPDMQGSDLLKAMAAEEIVSFPPVIVYTGRNLTRDEETELQRYSRSIIIKGARSPERLLDEVTLFLHKVEAELSSERQGMLKTARGRDRIFEGRTILLVDDDVRNIFALTSALEQRGAAVEIGRNGREALEKLDQVREIDLVLMDVMMPEMDGLEATRRMRADPRFEKMPVIAITAKAMKDDREQCLAAGANDYLAKPVDLERLFSLLRVWMPKMERL
ncbi:MULTISPECIES: response regulator [Variovorax]|jgi:CheY-like chemotaxis protein/signal transduction histidine kinase|uniref:response regulator n=1 Tax=Variovorax TaxID=34072 RepID=UPI00086CC351|nr:MULTISPECIES: response regulator [Variovorax]MBN8751973.1 response regulator [Variovorax sp.]ODU17780.1 MAG: two-component system sensor histidine kinase/response regulator [Variovorax sp. SCN 67-85]ODV27137.1 MAG: two-component system sensor histidine kinase/response regulator [Variovorax sp. SCN 67-20]OJZ09207.1 MAG: two-component system sensor histidine kinase/response regulator [Variovorax sp. 67-131]UKI11680.1 response regulator [Variovorax paradoxus]